MKKNKINPAKSKFSVLEQLCKIIPGHMVAKIARETGVEEQTRTLSRKARF